MNTLEIIVAVLSVVLMLKAVVSAIYAGMAAARQRLLREQTADQITAPADRLSRLRPVLPFASSAFGLIGVAGLAVFFALLFTGRGKDKPTLGANEMPRPTAENVPIPVSKTVPVQQQPEKPPVALAGGRTVEEIARKNDQAEVATADSSVQMAVRLAKTKQNEALLLASRVRSNSDELVAEMDRWDSLLSKLLTGDDGKALAAHPDLVRRYRAVVGAERPARTEIAEIQDQVSTLVEPIQAAYDNPADIAVPGAEVMKALSSTFAVFWGFPEVGILAEMVGVGQVPHLAQGGYHAHHNRPYPQAVVPETTPQPVPCLSTPTGSKSSCVSAAD